MKQKKKREYNSRLILSKLQIMRLSVRFNDKWLVIPCGEGDKSVEWLIEETMRRSETPNLLAAQNYKAVLIESGGTLRANDHIKAVSYTHLTLPTKLEV